MMVSASNRSDSSSVRGAGMSVGPVSASRRASASANALASRAGRVNSAMTCSMVSGSAVASPAGRPYGVMPNFFCTATAAPGLIDELWTFAKSAYLDSPLPSLFKERLFVYLSRFCAVRYCIVRHVGFLIGEGRPAGDAAALPESIEQVIALLTRPARDARALEEGLARLEALTGPANIP